MSSGRWRVEMCLRGEEGKWIGKKTKKTPQRVNFVRKDLNI